MRGSMGNDQADKKKFTWVIKNFSSLQSEKIYSDQFVIDGCRWRLLAFPKGNSIKSDHLSLYLEVAESESLPCGWRRHAQFFFTIVNHIPGKFSQRKETTHWFCEKVPDWGFTNMFPLNELKAKDSGFLVNGDLKIIVEIEVLEVIGLLNVSESMMDVNGFHVLPSQVKYVKSLFEIHPDIASKFRIKNQYLKTGYMNVLLSLIETVRRSPKEISKADLDDAYVALESLTDYGFKLDWLKKNLDQVSEKKEKEEAGETRRKEIEEELKDLKLKCSGLETHLEKVKRKCSDLEGQLLEQKAEVLAAIAPLSSSDDGVFDDFF
ncbi:MATH/TRAF domain [Arabidopsis thaliana x Arabidopsis arenosa]|uniref:MATH/TRAF domain n=1 Tax=Arabidopsis thaliana x Arabidopsis arenosa TaxID=1240361 RepID=A0A8T1ZPD3_9BRAS|nr:MATH/TRAF domain [Arabidopsis thaliana x Arabidopsis arenosa]